MSGLIWVQTVCEGYQQLRDINLTHNKSLHDTYVATTNVKSVYTSLDPWLYKSCSHIIYSAKQGSDRGRHIGCRYFVSEPMLIEINTSPSLLDQFLDIMII